MHSCNSKHRKLLVICAVPDPGHLIALLKIAAQARCNVADVQAIIPDELRHVAERCGVECHTFGAIGEGTSYEYVTKYLHAAGLLRLLKYNRLVKQYYFSPLQRNIQAKLKEITRLVDYIRPTVMLADEHYFRPQSIRLAKEQNVPLLLHDLAANAKKNQNTLTLGSMQSDLRDLTDLAGELTRKVRGELSFGCRRFTRLRRPRAEARLFPFDASQLKSPRVIKIASGTALLEKIYLKELVNIDSSRVIIPLLPPLASPIEPRLQTWLANSNKDVAYISFGTMISPDQHLLDSLVQEFLVRGIRVLVQSPGHLNLSHSSSMVRLEKWVSQSSILSHNAVKLFVSHAGAGAVQEAIWAAKPMLCIPHGWDQYYNAWIAQELGVGKSIGKSQPRRMSTVVRQLFRDLPMMQHRVNTLSAEAHSQFDTWRVEDLFALQA